MFEDPNKKTEFLLLPEAYKRAEEVLEKKRINIDEFASLYGSGTIAEDKKKLAERELQINDFFRDDPDHRQEHTLELATVFHAITVNNVSWFGMPTNTTVHATTRFDDVFHGVDAVVEKNSPEGLTHLGLAVDVTFGHSAKKKVEHIKNHINHQSLTRVKYFKSEEKGFRGEISELPSVVVGVSGDTVKELANLFARKEDTALELHQVQFQILDQILLQCDYFASYADAKGSPHLADKYKKVSAFISQSYHLSRKLVDGGDKGIRDIFHTELLEVLNQK